MPPDIDLSSAIKHPLAAGLAGALIGLRFAPGVGWLDRAINVISGGAIAGYVGPAAAEFLALSSPAAQSALGFGLGLFGISLATVLMQTLRDLRLAEILADRMRGGGGK
jgi:hypothetical protein